MWFDESTAGMIGAITGCLVGGVGGTMGTLSRLWAAKGKHRKAIKVFLLIFLIIGSVFTVTGLIALFSGQPRHVWYVFILVGPLMVVLGLILRKEVIKLYLDAETKKMEITDA